LNEFSGQYLIKMVNHDWQVEIDLVRKLDLQGKIFLNEREKIALYSNSASAGLVLGDFAYRICNDNNFEELERLNHQTRIPDDVARLFIWVPYSGFNFSNLLDLGCGKGLPVGLARAFNIDSFGVEKEPEFVEIAKRNLMHMKEDPARIFQGDYLTQEFWDKDISGKKPGDFDLLHLYNWEEQVGDALPYLSKQVSEKTRLAVTGIDFVEPHESLEDFGWQIDRQLPCYTLLRKLV
jgi:SAM-dependent methyltransferase